MKKLAILTVSTMIFFQVAWTAFASSDTATHVQTSQGVGAAQRVGTITHYVAAADVPARVDSRWTASRMAAAEPRGLLVKGTPTLTPSERQEGRGSVVPQRLPGAQPDAAIRSEAAYTIPSSGGYEYPPPFSRFELPGLPDYTSYPYRTVGKIFGSDAAGDYVCSGAAVNSDNGSVVWTAAHCLYSAESGWFEDLVFVPAYRDGATPFETWDASDAWVPTRWISSGGSDSRADMGAAIVSPIGQDTLVDTVGGLGIAWNYPRKQHWQAFGYPAANPFGGERQVTCAASFAFNDSGRRPPMGIGCDMTPGSSGGPWIMKFGRQNYVNGLNSYKYVSLDKAMFSPYFGNNARDLFDCATDGVC